MEGTYMNNKWKKTALAVLITSSLMANSYTVLADGTLSTVTQVGTYYQLSDSLEVELKSLLNERSSDGIQVGAVVRLKNVTGSVTRVPEYEIRVKTEDGVEYTLQPSVSNAKSVQPKSKVELSYMATLDRQDEINLAELSWVDVDYYVYPKKETSVLTLNVAGQAWAGSNTVITDQAVVKKWGESFQIESENSPLIYTPVSLSKDNTATSPVSIVKLLVENNSPYRENVPAFAMDGKDDQDVFKGERVEQEEITLEAGEKAYIHFAISTDQDTELKSINVVTPESFVQGQGLLATVYSVGRLNILLPSSNLALTENAVAYKLNDPITFDTVSDAINPNVKVSLVELSMHDSEGVGYQTAVAKFKLTNTSVNPIPMPNFLTEIQSADGFSYSGNRQNRVPQSLMPNLSHVVSYSYIVPGSEKGENLTLKLQNAVSATTKSTVAALNVAVQQPASDTSEVLSFYPFGVKLNYWTIGSASNLSSPGMLLNTMYAYKLKMDMEITQLDGIVVDQDSSMMKVALVDSLDRIVAEENLSFVTNTEGARKLLSGENIVTFNNVRSETMESNYSLKIYETFNTPTGEAKRLVATLKF